MGDFFIWCAGADRKTLNERHPDRAKYVALGGTVVFTAVMAFVSSYYALVSTVGVPIELGLFIALAWGLGIFNFDRFLISGTRRQPTLWGNLTAFLPRLVMAVVLGLVIAEPLIMRVFDSDVSKEVQTMRFEDAAHNEEKLLSDPRYADLPEMQRRMGELQSTIDGVVDTAQIVNDPEIVELRRQLEAKESALADAQAAVNCEAEGKTDCPGSSISGSGKLGWGPAAGEKLRSRDDARAARDTARQQLDQKTSEVTDRVKSTAQNRQQSARGELAELTTKHTLLKEQLEADRAAFSARNSAVAGFLTRVKALNRLTDRERTVEISVWMVRLALILVDVMPVFSKFLMAIQGATVYENRRDRQEKVEDERAADDERTETEIRRIRNADRLRRVQSTSSQDVTIQQDLDDLVREAQRDVAKAALDIWKADVLADVRANPTKYIVN